MTRIEIVESVKQLIGLTDAGLSRRLNVSKACVSRWLSGKSKITDDRICRMSICFMGENKTVDKILNEEIKRMYE